MTLKEIAMNYREEADVLRHRIQLVRELEVHTEEEAIEKADRLRILEAMRRDMRDMAVICERYYQRDYHMCEKYSITYC